MRFRLSVTVAFAVTCLASLYLGLANIELPHDKAVHFAAFFLLATFFYWIIDTSRKRCVYGTLLVVSLAGGIGSEFAQDTLTDRKFDLYDIVANLAGSGLAITLSALYHQRLLDRRRRARYDRLRQNLADDVEAQVGPDIELDEAPAASP